MMTKLDHLNEAALDLIRRAKKTGQDDDWKEVGQWDLNAWNPDDLPADDDANWHVTAYPIINGETDTDCGIVLRGHYADEPAFPSIDALEHLALCRLADEDAGHLAEINQSWLIEIVDGPAIKVTPRSWAADPPSLVFPYDPTAGG
jgi:hypothetical protein